MLVACAATAVVVAGCGGDKPKAASQTAVKVNKEEITVHQINFLMQQQRGLRPEQADAATRQILERLVDQELALQQAGDLKLDRDPRVMQQLEAARREIIARAYFDRVGDAAGKPTADEIKAYYDAKPALFKERRIYSLQEIAVEATPEQVQAMRPALEEAKDINAFINYLKSQDIRFSGSQGVRAAEQLPLATLDTFAKLKDGQALMNPTPTGAQVVVLAGSRAQPIDLERARPAIEQFLVNERKRDLVKKDLSELRAAAKIEYVGKFAEGAPTAASAPAATAAPAPAPAPAPVAPEPAASAASGPLDVNSITKGLGIK